MYNLIKVIRNLIVLICCSFISLIYSCTTECVDTLQDSILLENKIPSYCPPINYPSDNQFTSERWLLGKKLFFEKRLSANNTISCGTCHKPELGFMDNTATSPGVENRPGTRNVPSLANVAYHPYYTREGAVPTLEMQVLVPIQEHNEFDFNIVIIAEELAKDSVYQQKAQKAYGRSLDPFVITRAIATFERSIISAQSAFDQFYYEAKRDAITESAKRGFALFNSYRTNCAICHAGFNFTNYAFENNALYELYKDPGRYRLTLDSNDLAKFKVPSLRNVAKTTPFMHDGSFKTLDEVIDHYNEGGKNHRNKSKLIRPLFLSAQEKLDLKNFLETLTDETFFKNPYYREK